MVEDYEYLPILAQAVADAHWRRDQCRNREERRRWQIIYNELRSILVHELR